MSSSVETVQVFVRTLTGKTVTLDICLTEDGFRVKLKIENKVGLPVEQQSLLFHGKQLDDVRPVSFYGIGNESMLHVLVRSRGGAPPVASLDVLAELLAAAERRALDVDGRCLLCCARYGKDKVCDEWHWGAQPHQKAEAWARRQLDGGYICLIVGASRAGCRLRLLGALTMHLHLLKLGDRFLFRSRTKIIGQKY